MNHTVLAQGVGFTEGPLWTRDGRLLVVAMSRGLVLEVDLGGDGVVGSIETGGGPNGLAEGPDGAVWVAQNAGAVRPSRSPRRVAPGLQRIDGRIVDDLPVPGALAPNDLTAGPDGRIWFTDPGVPGATTRGRVCALDPTSGQVAVLLGDLDFPNGLAFGPEGDVLYLARTEEGRVTRHRWDGARLSWAGVAATLPAGGPDGIALDVDGRLYAAAPDADAVFVFEPDGRLRRRLEFAEPTFPTNLCFAGPDLDRLVVTAAKGGRVVVLDSAATSAPGLVLPGLQPTA
jgi:gluconolactonase